MAHVDSYTTVLQQRILSLNIALTLQVDIFKSCGMAIASIYAHTKKKRGKKKKIFLADYEKDESRWFQRQLCKRFLTLCQAYNDDRPY